MYHLHLKMPHFSILSILIKCSYRCLSNNRWAVYQYKGTGPENCLLIHKNCSDADGQIFEDKGNGETFHKGWLLVCLLVLVTEICLI